MRHLLIAFLFILAALVGCEENDADPKASGLQTAPEDGEDVDAPGDVTATHAPDAASPTAG
jgi:hypothetical protein